MEEDAIKNDFLDNSYLSLGSKYLKEERGPWLWGDFLFTAGAKGGLQRQVPLQL